MKSNKPLYSENQIRAERMADFEQHKDCYNSKNFFQKRLHRQRLQYIKDMCGGIKNKRILDVGTGDGYMLRALDCRKLYAIDISKKRCERAKKLVPHAKISVQDIHKTNFKDNFFDGIICADVLEHVTNLDIATKEISRVVKKGGFIIACVPNQIAYVLTRAVFLKFPLNPDHINSITPYSAKKLFNTSPIKSLNAPNIPFPFCVSQFYKFIKR